jgi:feruloyl esterase
VATKWHNDTLTDSVYRQRPLCPYPKQAKYDGRGDPNKAESWHCHYIYDVNARYN